MRVFRTLEEFPAEWNSTVISIGNFDGVHCGHRQVLAEVLRRARELDARAVAVTFEPHPVRVLRPETDLRLLTPRERKLELLAETGIDAVLLVPFTAQFAATTAEQFSRSVIAGRLHAREVHEGAAFHFGKGAEGNIDRLAGFGVEFGFAVRVYRELQVRGEVVSSSRIRQLLAGGKVTQANRLLGAPFALCGNAARGRGLGTQLTVPTINLAPYPELLPRNGVYVTRTRVAGEQFESVTNVGVRPTMGDGTVTVETHLLDFRAIPLGESTVVEIDFLYRLRDEVKFPSPEALKAQIMRDVARTRRYFRLRGTVAAR